MMMWMVNVTSGQSCRRYNNNNNNSSNCLHSYKKYFLDSTSIRPACHRDRAERAIKIARSFDFELNRVLDLGAGCGDVKMFLREDEVYIPSDLRSRDFPVLECDYAREIPNVREIGAVFALGVLEWMCDPHLFLKALRTYNTSMMLSYTASDLHATSVPLANSLTSEVLERMLREVGFSIERKEIVMVRSIDGYADMNNLLYALTPSSTRRRSTGDFLFMNNYN